MQFKSWFEAYHSLLPVTWDDRKNFRCYKNPSHEELLDTLEASRNYHRTMTNTDHATARGYVDGAGNVYIWPEHGAEHKDVDGQSNRLVAFYIEEDDSGEFKVFISRWNTRIDITTAQDVIARNQTLRTMLKTVPQNVRVV